MRFKDFKDRTIELVEDSWLHIHKAHPEIELQDIALALEEPFEVRRSQKNSFVEMFYYLKTEAPMRFRLVVVKVMKEGNFISTAMTTSQMKKGETLYKKK